MPGILEVAGQAAAAGIVSCVAPDHQAVVVMLSAIEGWRVVQVATSWAAGHVLGLAFIAIVLGVLETGSASHSWMERLEQVGNYVIGAILLVSGAAFLSCRDRFFTEEWTIKAGGCCSGHGDCEATPIVAEPQPTGWRAQGLYAPIMGFLQGMFCPGVLMGAVFMVDQPPALMVEFLAVFVLSVVITITFLSTAYSSFMKRAEGAQLNKIMYFGSCGFCILLGVLFIGCTLAGRGELMHAGHNHPMKMTA
mmetsp:Transcript_66660/g.177716  ORF Transcript_66660/g.177716 Transcript_66660/m.177716 type:complete len:250 (-) Transcript_66660:48-797(-)